jgi:hypothetical protein
MDVCGATSGYMCVHVRHWPVTRSPFPLPSPFHYQLASFVELFGLNALTTNFLMVLVDSTPVGDFESVWLPV